MAGYEKMGPTGVIDFPTQPPMQNAVFYPTFHSVEHEYHPLLHPTGDRTLHEPELQYQHEDAFENDSALEICKPSLHNLQAAHGAGLRTFSVPHSRVPSTNSVHPPVLRKRKASSVDGFELGSIEPKRKALSVDELELLQLDKKPLGAQVHVQDPNGDYYDISGQTSPYSQFVPTPTGSTGFPAFTTNSSSPRQSSHHYSTSNASQISLAAPSPHTPAFSPSFTAVKSEQSPGAPMTPLPRPVSTSSPTKSTVPKLVRTSTIQQSPPGVINTVSVGQTQNFNPYAMYPLKANLKLKGDLETMKQNWTAEEREARRRLVEFKRTQSNCTINAEFGPVSPQDRQSGSICISCIWWKEKNEYFVTSVDTIYLLEALVGVRFTVEEKNRIRRNLEGFRPMTVSKAKTDSEEFFKVIMGFPHPKPRNIEKDVKVFPWKILSTALKKIISKYSASYSSTAGAIMTPPVSGFPHSNSHIEYYDMPPRTDFAVSNHVNPYQYQMAGDMSYIPAVSRPPPSLRMVPSVAPTPVPELQLQMPEFVPAYNVTGHYPYQTLNQIPQTTMGMAQQPMTAPPARMPTWDYPNFIDGHITTPHSAPPTGYPRTTMDAADFFPAMHYPTN